MKSAYLFLKVLESQFYSAVLSGTSVAPVKFGIAPNFVRDAIAVFRKSLAARAP